MKVLLISANTVRVSYYIYRSGLDYVTVAKLLKSMIHKVCETQRLGNGVMAGTCPVKGRNIKNYLTGKFPPLGRGASQFS